MSLGSFVQGAFQGYQFGENVKDRKAERKRNEERFEWERDNQAWRGEQRDRERENWDYTDTLRDRERENWDYTDTLRARQRDGWAREDEKRRKAEAMQDELDRIRNEGYEDWRRGQDGQPVPENTPQGIVRVPLDTTDGTGRPAPASAQATFPGVNVPGLSGPNPNAAPLRFGDDVPRMENRPIRVPLGQAGDDTVVGNMGGDMLLTDIQPVRGTYSEEERQARVQPQDTALTPNANSRAAVDYPYNPSSPEARAGIMQPGGERTAPRPPAETPRGMQSPNAMDPSYRAPIFSEIAAPDASRRAPNGPVSPEIIAAEAGNEVIRGEGPTTYGGGAQRQPGTPGLPVDPRAPAGPEAGQPQRQATRNARTPLADQTQMAAIPADTQEETGTLETPAAPDRSTNVAQGAVREVDPNASAFVQDVQELQRKGDIAGALERIKTGIATGKYGAAASPLGRAFGGVRDYFTATPEEGATNAAERQRAAEALSWYQSDEAERLFVANPELLSAASQDPLGFVDQRMAEGPAAPQPVGQPEAGAAQAAQQAAAPTPQGGGAGQPVYGGMTASQAAQFQDLPEPRMAIEDGGQPISVARDSLSSNANADNQGQAPQVSDQQRAQAAATFREYYQAEVVPRQIEALYQAGEIEKAEQLQTWFEDKRSQSLQKAYTDAVAAAALGDERGFFDNIGKVYNSFDDGYRFIADESDLYKNEAGATIAKVTLENTATGERFTQEYEGGDELIQQVLTQMDPISVFEQLRGQAEAEAAAAAEQQAWEIGLVRKRIEAGVETGEDRGAIVKDVMTELMKNPSFAQKSAEEQAIELENWMRLYDLASRGTASPQAPVYLGD